MLKAQLRSKIGVLGSEWQDIEDILTGDFFGALDYLPRQPFLCSFIEWVAAFNTDATQPPCEAVDWEAVEFIFWPMITGKDESAEPDVVIVSNRWVLVVEVKLDSGLGADQPWREYCVGREIAEDRGLPENSVFYLLVSRHRLNVAATFAEPDELGRRELLAKTSHLFWHQAVGLIERWLKRGPAQLLVEPEQERLLLDLLGTLRRRRSIAFSGFAFINQDPVFADSDKLFCPDRFAGFLDDSESRRIANAKESWFLSRFVGFLDSSPETSAACDGILVGARFAGFPSADQVVAVPSGPFMPVTEFSGFLDRCPRCSAASTLGISEM